MIEFASSWLPEEREWPGLYDDGPISGGGHEAEGQVAGDGIFSTELWFVATEDTTFEYGALNEESNWIWDGPNGTLTVPAGSTEVFDAGRIDFPAFGTLDMRLTIDLSKLNAEFATITAESNNVFVKGTMNSWSPVQLLDDGLSGDEEAGDGVFTYLHSTKLGDHDGLLNTGQSVQFVFVFALKEQFVEDGIEYKFPIDALADGVRAYTGGGGTWIEEEVILTPASDGNVKNTGITVTATPVEEPECGANEPCPSGQNCIAGACVGSGSGCTSDDQCSDGFECLEGTCVQTAPECSDSEGCAGGDICVGGTCITPECTSDEDCTEGFVCVAGTCALDLSGDGPQVSLVDPATGTIAGGTAVTVSGVGFVDGATVSFGGIAATEVEVLSTGTITCVTPSGAVGPVAVKVENPDGQSGLFSGGFTYTENAAPSITSVEPGLGNVSGGDVVTITGSDFQVGATIQFGVYTATNVAVATDGASLTCKTPSVDTAGTVDVTVQNPDGQSSTLNSAFTFELGPPAYAQLLTPYDVSVTVGAPPSKVSAVVYHPGITEADGAGEGLIAELGYGLADTEPTSDWTWATATYAGQGGDFGNDDVWEGDLLVAEPGTYDWAFRFSFDGEQWTYADRNSVAVDYQVEAAGTYTVAEVEPGLQLFSVTPYYASTDGTTAVTLTGQDLDTVQSVEFGGQTAAYTVVDSTTITTSAPASVAGPTTITVSDGMVTKSASFQYAELVSVTTDGLFSEWPTSAALADDSSNNGWDFNDLNTLYVGFDGESLAIGVDGVSEATNAVVVYLDFDYGNGTGQTPATLQDNIGSLDSALSGAGISVLDSGFGAEQACGAFGASDVAGYSDTAGCRSLGDPTDLAWLSSTVVWSTEGVEFKLPWSELNYAPIPGGRTLGVFARIVNQDGGLVSPEGLPSSAAADGSVDSVVTIWIP
jgi:hypothetical protein